MNALSARHPSFYAPVPDADRADDLFESYAAFLRERNGGTDPETGFTRREAWMQASEGWDARYSGRVPLEAFLRNYERFDGRDLSEDALALLAFVKLNAAEAYGVEVTSTARAHLQARDEPIYRVEKVLGHEERYHTRMLVGAVQHFEGVEVGEAWTPKWHLRLLIGALASFPGAIFHPVLLGSEISGVYTFNWMLSRLGTLFKDDPEIRESMERRLIEVLIDEVGHIAFNRIAVGSAGRAAARQLAGLVILGNASSVPEMPALGMDAGVCREIAGFDYMSLPEEVRARAWFV
ncbi:MAG: hypothetical protein H6741_31155 [Alphaproteobacteria bacterium]|nr:hypothetical protein [Alphaproteobacteria bacterium]